MLSFVTQGDSYTKVTGLLVGKFKLNPLGRPMWVLLKLKLTPKGSILQTDITKLFCKFLYAQP